MLVYIRYDILYCIDKIYMIHNKSILAIKKNN